MQVEMKGSNLPKSNTIKLSWLIIMTTFLPITEHISSICIIDLSAGVRHGAMGLSAVCDCGIS